MSSTRPQTAMTQSSSASEEPNPHTDEELEKAAIKIQSSMRGKMARSETLKRKELRRQQEEKEAREAEARAKEEKIKQDIENARLQKVADMEAELEKLKALAPTPPQTPPPNVARETAQQLGASIAPLGKHAQPGLAASFYDGLHKQAAQEGEFVKQTVANTTNNLLAAEKAVEDLTEMLDQAHKMQAKLIADGEEVKQELDYLKKNPKQDRTTLLKFQGLQKENLAAQAVQNEQVVKTDRQLYDATRVLYAARLEASYMTDLQQESKLTAEIVNSRHKSIAQDRASIEDKHLSKYQRKQAAHQEAREAEEEEERQRDEKVIQDALEHRKLAVQRLQATRGPVHSSLAAGHESEQAIAHDKINAVLELKNSIAESSRVTRGQAGQKAKKDKQKAADEQAEAKELLEAGLNPYEVFRRRENDARVAKAKQAHAERVAKAEMETTDKMLKEQVKYERERERRRQEKAERRVFDDEMGNVAREARTDAFMEKVTKTGETMLNPTGNVPWDPSKVTQFKTWDFGTGRADPALVKQLQDKHNELPNPLLIPTDHYATLKDKKALGVTFASEGAEAAPGEAPAGEAAAAAGDDSDDDAAPAMEQHVEQQVEQRRIVVPPVSKFEQQRLAEALERQKQGVVRKQIVWGREFKGAAFLAKPSQVYFKDFQVGGTYKIRFQLTNVSYTFNTFKLLDIEDEFKDFFTVEYTFPGQMSAGMTCNVTVTFEPKLNKDIETVIPCLASTGPFSIPLICHIRRRKITCQPGEYVHFGAVALAETRRAKLTLVNDGALSANFQILPVIPGAAPLKPKSAPKHRRTSMMTGGYTPSEPAADEDPSTKDLSDTPEVQPVEIPEMDTPFTFPTGGRIEGYSKVDLDFSFAPTVEEASSLNLQVFFTTPDVPTMKLEITGVGGQVPIAVERDVVDMKCCVYDMIYRDHIVIHNRGKTALKCSIVKRKELAPYMEFSPELLYCQGGTSAYFNVKFQPKRGLFEALGRLADPETGSINVPIRINIPDQALPVHFDLRARITNSDITFDPPNLDFGRCPISESVAARLNVTNNSMLPQQYGFVQLPQGVEIQDPNQYGTLLPGETKQVVAVWSPPIIGPSAFQLTFRTLLVSRSFHVPCVAHGFTPPLKFSNNVIHTAATPIFDTCSSSVIVTNTSKVPQTFEFTWDPESHLKFQPLVGTLQPRESTRIQVDYTPLPDPEPVRAAAPEAPEGAEEAAAAEGEGAEEGAGEASTAEAGVAEEAEEEEEDAARWVRRKVNRCVCFVKGMDNMKLYLEVHTCAVDASLTITELDGAPYVHPVKEEPKGPAEGEEEAAEESAEEGADAAVAAVKTTVRSVPRLPEGGLYQIDFGQVPVGRHKIRRFAVMNHAKEGTAELNINPLDHTGIFSMLSARRPIEPGESEEFVLDFAPQKMIKYNSILIINSTMGRIRCAISGEGISPTLELDPPTELLDVGDAYAGEACEQVLNLVNTAPFLLTYEVFLEDLSQTNLDGTIPFTVDPIAGSIPPGEKQELKVTFLGDHEPNVGVTDQFTARMRIKVASQLVDKIVQLRSRCFERGMFIIGCDKPEVVKDPFLALNSAAATLRRTPPEGVEADPLKVTLTFDEPVTSGASVTKKVEIGNLAIGGKGGPGGEYTIEGLTPEAKEQGWGIDATDGKVDSGMKKEVEFTFAPPAQPPPSALAAYGLDEVYETTVLITLKGGGVPPASSGKAPGERVIATPATFSGPQTIELTMRCLLKAS